jgi:hypothetical protein
MASNRILNFFSAHPKKMIHNVAKSFARKVFDFSDAQFHEANKVRVKDILHKNSFPHNEIAKIIQSAFTSEAPRNTAQAPHSTTNTHYCSLAYVPRVSEALTKRLKYFLPDVTVANRPDFKNTRFFSKQKNKLSTNKTSNCVYQIDCKNCPNVYIGETTTTLEKRMYAHRNSVAPQNVHKPSTALARHSSTTSHEFNFDNISVLDRNNNKSKLKICEVTHIIKNQHIACNFKSDSSNITRSYGNLLRTRPIEPVP